MQINLDFPHENGSTVEDSGSNSECIWLEIRLSLLFSGKKSAPKSN